MNKRNTFYITTPIYYPSAKLHIGNSYSTVAADALARYHRLIGEDVYFLTGTDEHGQKIQQKAAEANMQPQKYVDKMAQEIQALWKKLDISNDGFVRTTDSNHKQAVQQIFERLLAQGDIYLGEYEGWYSVSDEEFFTETQLAEVYRDENGKVIGGIAPTGKEVELVKEESYFFKLSNYAEQLIDYYNNHDKFLVPESRRNEMINNFIKPGLEDLAVSRTSFDWGIPVLSNPKHVVYVWLDALMNYITHLGYGSEDTQLFDKYWPANVQIIGKDISRFHMIFWPIFLMALDIPLPKTIYAHGWIVMKDGKMSKSLGNVIYPEMLINRFGLDATRFYLLREMGQGNDSVFTPEDFVNRVNVELANDLGNLLNRTIAMINKYFDGLIPTDKLKHQVHDADENYLADITSHIKRYYDSMEAIKLNQAIDHIMAIVSRSNKYIDETAPWVLAKDDTQVGQLRNVIYHLVDSLRIVALMLQPFMTQAPERMLQQLGIDEAIDRSIVNLSLGDFPENCQVVAKGEPIFPRLDVDAEVAYIHEQMQGPQPSSDNTSVDDSEWKPEEIELKFEETKTINFEDFMAMELKVAEIIDVAPVQGSNKLLRFRLDAGDKGHRQILSGIAQAYPEYEALRGRKVIIVANLKPRKMMGYMSQGMILSAEDGSGLHLIFASDDIANGSLIG